MVLEVWPVNNTVNVAMLITGIIGLFTLGWVDTIRRVVRSATGTLSGGPRYATGSGFQGGSAGGGGDGSGGGSW